MAVLAAVTAVVVAVLAVATNIATTEVPPSLQFLTLPSRAWMLVGFLIVMSAVLAYTAVRSGDRPRQFSTPEQVGAAADRLATRMDKVWSPRVTTRGSGAALARDVSGAARVIRAMVEAVDVPVTAKMRLGWDHSSINAPELARALESSGCAMVTVHGRTRAQRYTGQADWAEIARVKQAVRIPVVGSGDVTDVREIRRRLLLAEVDGVVVARGALGNLWFIRQAVHHVATGELLPDLGFADRIELTRRHLELLIEHYGEARALVVGRKYVAWTIKGCNGAAKLRAMVQTLVTRADLDAILGQALAAGLGPGGWFQPIFTSGEG